MTNGNGKKNGPGLKKIAGYFTIFLTICSVIGVLFALDARWAKVENVETLKTTMKQLEVRLDNKIKADRVKILQDRIWQFEDRWPKADERPAEITDSIRSMRFEMEELLLEIKSKEE